MFHDQVLYDAVEFARRLAAEGVQTRPFFKGMHEQTVYNRIGLFAGATCPVTERIYRRGLYLLSGQAITDRQIDDVVKAVRKVLA